MMPGFPCRLSRPRAIAQALLEQGELMAGSLARQRKIRRWHRTIAMVASVQLLLWTLSGLYFAFVDIDFVRGGQFRVDTTTEALSLEAVSLPAVSAKALRIQPRLQGELIVGVEQEAGIIWLDAAGADLAPLTAAEALLLGGQRTTLLLDQIDWVDREEPGSEFRGVPLPLWRLYGEQDPTRVVYLDAFSGDVVAVRHQAWRWWDFLWSLHIMSYTDRDTIGTVLLKVFSILALATAVLGVWLYVQTRRTT